MRVLITDATYKHALAAVRSLGRRGHHVTAGASRRFAQAFYSKYCQERLIYPDPRNEEPYIQCLNRYTKEHRIDVLLPIGYWSNMVVSKHQARLAHVHLPIAAWEIMRVAGDKARTMAAAQKAGVAVPRQYATPAEVNRFPVVVKRVAESGGVRYVNSAEELSQIDTAAAIIQEYVSGAGYGFFALFDRGACRAFFMHRRRREYPVTGGASTAAESVFDPQLKETGLKLLTALQWHGVAMVEFKKDDRDGSFKLMEINPKFWGSLDLAITCGVDFPHLATQLAAAQPLDTVAEYTVGRKYRWLIPDDLMHLVSYPRSLGAFVKDTIDRNTFGNFAGDDMKPNLFQWLVAGPLILSRIARGNFRRPHGVPLETNDS